MLNRDQQKLLGAAGSGIAASALLDEMRERTTLEGGCSAPQPNCWISYNRKAIWLEDHSGFGEAIRAAGTDKQAWRRIKPDVLVKVTWAEAAAHGAALPASLREELDALRRTHRAEDRSWSEFSTARGGWPWRRRFATDEAHQVAQTEWDQAYAQHLSALRDVWDQMKAAVARALPLIADDEPVDLLELLNQQPTPAPVQPTGAALQAAALQPAPYAPKPAITGDGVLSLPNPSPIRGL
jgi:hypothetical protein